MFLGEGALLASLPESRLGRMMHFSLRSRGLIYGQKDCFFQLAQADNFSKVIDLSLDLRLWS
jgi:hypothetical protein